MLNIDRCVLMTNHNTIIPFKPTEQNLILKVLTILALTELSV